MNPGDFLLVHGDHFISKLIRFGQAFRFRGDRRKFARWNHAALVLDEKHIAEALSTGVVISPIDKYQHVSCRRVRIPLSVEDRAQIELFAKSVLDARWKYGYFTILGIAFSTLTGSKFMIGRVGTAICSGFVSEALTRAGYVFERPPAYMTPADLAEAFNVV